jgi:nucleotidyltransferase substrate binding protein (TIGR01987 family)
MYEKNIRWKLRFDSFSKAFLQLEKAVQQKTLSEMEQEALIHRFEYTLELAWKTLQDYLDELGFVDIKGPKPAIKQAFQNNIIADGNLWIDMLDSRNLTVHSYDEETSNKITNKIINYYYFAIRELRNTLFEEYSKEAKFITFGLDNKYCEMIKNVLNKIDEIEQVIIFGRRATGTEKNGSDIDLALKGENVNHNVILKVLAELEDLPVAYKFDVVNYNTVSLEVKEQIDKYGKIFVI